MQCGVYGEYCAVQQTFKSMHDVVDFNSSSAFSLCVQHVNYHYLCAIYFLVLGIFSCNHFLLDIKLND